MLVALGMVVTTAFVASALIGPPEIDPANVVFSLSAKPTAVSCPGEDAPDTYTTVTGVWKGSETEATPGSTDYLLTGKLVYRANVTFNTTTARGVMQGKATLTVTPVAGGPGVIVYSGPLTLVVQKIDTTGGFLYVGRGFLNAATYAAGATGTAVPDGGRVLANVEVAFPPAGASPGFASMVGQFGDAPALPTEPLVKDYSVVTVNNTCA